MSKSSLLAPPPIGKPPTAPQAIRAFRRERTWVVGMKHVTRKPAPATLQRVEDIFAAALIVLTHSDRDYRGWINRKDRRHLLTNRRQIGQAKVNSSLVALLDLVISDLELRKTTARVSGIGTIQIVSPRTSLATTPKSDQNENLTAEETPLIPRVLSEFRCLKVPSPTIDTYSRGNGIEAVV